MAEEEKEGKPIVETIKEEKIAYSKKAIFFLVVGVLFIIALLGVGVYFLLFVKEKEEIPGLSEMESEFKASMQSEIVRVSEPTYVKTQKYAVNLRDGRHYLQLSVVFVLQDPIAQTFLDNWKPVVDDIVISILKKKNINILRTRSGLELLKLDILRETNQLLVKEFLPTSITKDRSPVKGVLFTDFVLN